MPPEKAIRENDNAFEETVPRTSRPMVPDDGGEYLLEPGCRREHRHLSPWLSVGTELQLDNPFRYRPDHEQ